MGSWSKVFVAHGLGIADAEGKTSTWVHGPKFLWQNENTWPKQDSYGLCEEDHEVKHSLKTNLTSSRTTTLLETSCYNNVQIQGNAPKHQIKED